MDNLTPEEKATNHETWKHIHRVRDLITDMVMELLTRASKHDQSKLKPPEVSIFTEFTPKLRGMAYGSDEYKACLKAMGPALDNHYKSNRHHPEHFENGINGMNLLDLLEMFCDWKAAGERQNGNLYRSIEINARRFNIDEQLESILLNTIELLGEEKPGERGIWLAPWEVKAFLDRKKVQICRAIRPQPKVLEGEGFRGGSSLMFKRPVSMSIAIDACRDGTYFKRFTKEQASYYGAIGDRLWGKEEHCWIDGSWDIVNGGKEWDPDLLVYRVDKHGIFYDHFNGKPTGKHWDEVDDVEDLTDNGWRPAYEMTRVMSRITLDIKKVIAIGRTEEVDFKKEGADSEEDLIEKWDAMHSRSIYKWENNPLVWKFEVEQI